jgi:polysaccharide biosynthesis/export protein
LKAVVHLFLAISQSRQRHSSENHGTASGCRPRAAGWSAAFRGIRRRLAASLACAALVGACGPPPPPVTVKALPSPVVSHQADVLDPALVARALGDNAPVAYQIGPGDTVLVAVYRHPELSITFYTGASLNTPGGRLAGLVVDNDGTIQFPLIGSVQVAGKTAEQLRVFLEQELGAFIKEPNVTVQVVFAGSIRYYLLGQFTAPGMKFSDRPLHLLEALSLGGSVQFERASLRSAYVARSGRRLPVNFQRLIREGDLKQNIVLESGDVILIPDNANEQAFVFGGAPGSNPRGGAVPFVNGQLSLLQALATVGFGQREHFQGKLSKTVVIRSESDRGEMFMVDAERILDGEAASFALVPGDVVYVPATALTDFNQALEQLLPTLQTISGLLTPFVQIKFLSQE